MPSSPPMQMALELDLPQAPLAIGAGYICCACGNKAPLGHKGRDCPVCPGWLVDRRAWDEPEWLAELTGGSDG